MGITESLYVQLFITAIIQEDKLKERERVVSNVLLYIKTLFTVYFSVYSVQALTRSMGEVNCKAISKSRRVVAALRVATMHKTPTT